MKRNDVCTCRRQRPTRFCLCQDALVLLCNECRLTHEEKDKEEFHDMYPYEMIPIYEQLGRDSLLHRKSQLKAAKSVLQSLCELESTEYSSTLDALIKAQEALELVHKSCQELISATLSEVKTALLTEVELSLGLMGNFVVAQGNRKQGTAAFHTLYNVQSAQVLGIGYLRLSAGNIEQSLLQLLSLDQKVESNSCRSKRTLPHKTLSKDANSRSAYLTPRRSSKPKLSPYKPNLVYMKTAAKRKNSSNQMREMQESRTSFLNSTNQLISTNEYEDSIFKPDPERFSDVYHSPSVLGRTSGPVSRASKPAEDLLRSIDTSYIKQKHASDSGKTSVLDKVLSPIESVKDLDQYLSGIPQVLRNTIKLQQRIKTGNLR